VAFVAAGTGIGAQDDEVPLYTNADLEKFGPPSAPAPETPPPATETADGQWRFVQEHLEREYARMAYDRGLELEESLGDPAYRPEENAPAVYPYYGWGLWGGWYDGSRYGRSPYREPGRYHALPYYDLRTARHGYLVPRKDAPSTVRHPDRRPGGKPVGEIRSGRPGARGTRPHATVRGGGSSRTGKVSASSGRGRSSTRGSVRGGRSAGPSRATPRGGNRGRSGGRGSRR
jgi:hypothetical protein